MRSQTSKLIAFQLDQKGQEKKLNTLRTKELSSLYKKYVLSFLKAFIEANKINVFVSCEMTHVD